MRVAILMPKMFRAQTTKVAPILSIWIWPCVGSAQISGANTDPSAAAVPAVLVMNEMNAIQPVNQP